MTDEQIDGRLSELERYLDQSKSHIARLNASAPWDPVGHLWHGLREVLRILRSFQLPATNTSESPIPMRLPCPSCGALHIDEGDFATRVHHTHSCQSCGMTWRPAVVPTVGVRFLPGFKNEAAVSDDGPPSPLPETLPSGGAALTFERDGHTWTLLRARSEPGDFLPTQEDATDGDLAAVLAAMPEERRKAIIYPHTPSLHVIDDLDRWNSELKSRAETAEARVKELEAERDAMPPRL